MATTFHKDITPANNHAIHSFSASDISFRDALVVTPGDVGKVCRVTSTGHFYVLTNASPKTWLDLTATVTAQASTSGVVLPDSVSYTYDSSGRVSTTTEVRGSETTVIGYTYNAAGNVVSITTAVDGTTTRTETYTYDSTTGNVTSMSATTP